MAMPNRNVQGGYRYGYQGDFAETDPETGKVAFELRLYDPRINRWLTTDPKGEFHSPYLAMGNNWINKIDPDGGSTAEPNDWFRDQNGNLKWFDNDSQAFSDLDGNTWTNTNYGDELLQFDGNNLIYSIQEGNPLTGFSLTQYKFDADSGRPLINDTAMPWRTYNFDYSDAKQLKVGEGPIPEGNYHIFKDRVQIWDELSVGQQLKASIGRGQWPGGEKSWGAYRFEIYPKSVTLSGGVVRGNFFVHGGEIPGSAGCIDLCGGINGLYSKLIQNQQNKVHLLVMYND